MREQDYRTLANCLVAYGELLDEDEDVLREAIITVLKNIEKDMEMNFDIYTYYMFNGRDDHDKV